MTTTTTTMTTIIKQQVNGTEMPSGAGAEHTIHSRIGEIKQRDQPIVVDFEKPSGEHQVLTFESYVTRADLKAALRSEGLAAILEQGSAEEEKRRKQKAEAAALPSLKLPELVPA